MGVWPQKILEQCLDYISRGVAPKYVEKSEIAALNQKAIRWWYIEKDYLKYHDSLKAVREDAFIKQGDIVVNSTGDITIGRAYYFKKAWPNLFADSHVTILRLNRTILLPEFLIYLFPTKEYQSRIYNLVTGATGQLELSRSNLSRLVVDVPPIDAQRRIASILSAYDDLIENNTRRIKILEEMARLIYREWFVEFRPTGAGAPGVRLRKATPEEKKVTGKDVFPEGWEVKKLGELATEKRESVDPKSIDPETPYLGLEHIPRRSLALQSWGKASDVGSTKLAFNVDDILFGKIRPYFHKVGPAPLQGVCSSDTIVVTTTSKESWAIVLMCMSSDDFVSHASQTSQGTKMPRASWEVLTKYPVLYPTKNVLVSFENCISNTVKQLYNLTFQNINLRQTRDLLLPKLMSGEVEA